MSAAASNPGCRWEEIVEQALTMKGRGSGANEPSLSLVAHSVLISEEAPDAPLAIGFRIMIALPECCALAPFRIEANCGFYGSLTDFRSELRAFGQGTTQEVSLALVGLTVTLFRYERGARSRLCVKGALSSLPGQHFPWPDSQDALGDLLVVDSRGPAACLNFAFESSEGDPPYLGDFRRDVDALLQAFPGL
jgi:hypothetical protein